MRDGERKIITAGNMFYNRILATFVSTAFPNSNNVSFVNPRQPMLVSRTRAMKLPYKFQRGTTHDRIRATATWCACHVHAWLTTDRIRASGRHVSVFVCATATAYRRERGATAWIRDRASACYVVEGHPLAAVARFDSLTDGAGETASSSSSSPTPSPQSPMLIEHEINAIV